MEVLIGINSFFIPDKIKNNIYINKRISFHQNLTSVTFFTINLVTFKYENLTNALKMYLKTCHEFSIKKKTIVEILI